MANRLLQFGEPAPWFSAPTESSSAFHFDTVAGRYVLLMFFQSTARADSNLILTELMQQRMKFDDDFVTFFGVSTDPLDQQLRRVQEQVPGMRFYWDFDQSVSRLYGALQTDPATGQEKYVCHAVLLDTRLRTLITLPFDEPATYVTRLLRMMETIPPLAQPTLAATQAPVLIVPRVFEPDFCRQLINQYEQHGGTESGFMRDEAGKTVGVYDHGHKRRQDFEIQDEQLRRACMIRIHNRLAPEIEKAFQFKATRMERYIVACYDGSQGAHFRAHRDNTTKGTAHRKFAVSLVLNTGEFDGGFVWFPEYGRQLFAPPAGGAVVFSCSLLHEATPVTSGKRFVFLPFLYDDAAARLREQNMQFVGGDANTPQQAQQAAIV
ncbi:MAG: 2OG-Fe(II) oxygenase [Planctomycetia bacterium]|nr:2OG-Fe(II) oxygenase [Planctomycetia bacterium]